MIFQTPIQNIIFGILMSAIGLLLCWSVIYGIYKIISKFIKFIRK